MLVQEKESHYALDLLHYPLTRTETGNRALAVLTAGFRTLKKGRRKCDVNGAWERKTKAEKL
jgi:hypothetical protein